VVYFSYLANFIMSTKRESQSRKRAPVGSLAEIQTAAFAANTRADILRFIRFLMLIVPPVLYLTVLAYLRIHHLVLWGIPASISAAALLWYAARVWKGSLADRDLTFFLGQFAMYGVLGTPVLVMANFLEGGLPGFDAGTGDFAVDFHVYWHGVGQWVFVIGEGFSAALVLMAMSLDRYQHRKAARGV
jgi:hypothetical protein